MRCGWCGRETSAYDDWPEHLPVQTCPSWDCQEESDLIYAEVRKASWRNYWAYSSDGLVTSYLPWANVVRDIQYERAGDVAFVFVEFV